VACDGNERVDFRSILDTQTDTLLSLGNDKSTFDEALGQGVYNELASESWQMTWEGARAYNYINTGFTVVFYNEIAMQISMWKDIDRIEFYQMSFDMTDAEVSEHFNRRSLLQHGYYRYFDSDGQDVLEGEEDYFARLIRGPGVGNLNLTIGVRGWENE
jgi:hypothetical protein